MANHSETAVDEVADFLQRQLVFARSSGKNGWRDSAILWEGAIRTLKDEPETARILADLQTPAIQDFIRLCEAREAGINVAALLQQALTEET